MVPGSTLMYGSSLSIVTLRPRDSRIAAREAAAIPLPREETTPPVTKTYLVISFHTCRWIILAQTGGALNELRARSFTPPAISPRNRVLRLAREVEPGRDHG